jgi:tetratricopeptide (TPR) repeat protein
LIAIGVIWLQGCASTPSANETGPAVSEFSSENLDLIFATEFPVASKDEALVKAASAYRDGKLDEAQFYLVRALKFDKSDTEVLVQIGNLHARQGNTKLAARAFQFALQQEPEHAASLEGMGLLYFKARNDDEAQKHLELAIASAPSLWRSYNDSKYLSEDYHAAALDFYAVTERSNNKRAWRNLALVYGKQGWYDDALETFLRIGEESYAYNETGVIAMSNGDTDEALHYLTEAVRTSPTYFAQAEKNLAELRKKGSRSYVN